MTLKNLTLALAVMGLAANVYILKRRRDRSAAGRSGNDEAASSSAGRLDLDLSAEPRISDRADAWRHAPAHGAGNASSTAGNSFSKADRPKQSELVGSLTGGPSHMGDSELKKDALTSPSQDRTVSSTPGLPDLP